MISRNDRIREHSSDEANRRIEQEIQDTARVYRGQDASLVARRIEKVEQEWDIDRAMMLNFALVALPFTLAGFFKDRRFLMMPLIQMGFMIQHATVGWCPPMPVFRAFGFRSRHEIEAELSALKGVGDGHGEQPAARAEIRSTAGKI